MQVKTIYVADDGTEFDNEEDCKKHENRVSFSFQKEYSIGTEITLRIMKHTSCDDCVFKNFESCSDFRCDKQDRVDSKYIMYKLVEVNEP